ncbi:class E sortase [Streptomyces sp. HNM0574]|uniref:class E sortase n=1 Tax=Streptomyces sp. HNM0574 TaxID=2714954 RepID=UPI00146BF46A|nr:class E sortase [Streptomyces sp. HNM0574]
MSVRVSVRGVVRTFSELCITGGVLIVLFVVYFLYWTGVQADSAGAGEISRLQDRWASGSLTPGTSDSADAPDEDAPGSSGEGLAGPDGTGRDDAGTRYPDGGSFAVMYIPRFGRDWARPVLENTEKQTLRKGLGHYAETAALGGRGNFAVAGHRRTYGDPFKDFPQLRPGDAVVLSDGRTWYTYRIDDRPYKTVPSDTGVLDPVPDPLTPSAAPYRDPGRYLTLTTCEPEWGSSHRLIAWAHLDATQPVAEGRPDVLDE